MAGWQAKSSGSVASYTDNNIAGNSSDEDPPPPIGYK
jgi:hypothetical protein